MRVGTFNNSFFSNEASLRFDANYVFVDKSFSDVDYYIFDELFDIVEDDSVDVSRLSCFSYAEIGHVNGFGEVEPLSLSWDERNEFNENYFKKIEAGNIIKVQVGDILISKVRPNLNKVIFIDDVYSSYYYTSAFLHIRAKSNAKVLYYGFRTIFSVYLRAIARQGKGYPTLNERDLHYLKFPKSLIDHLSKCQVTLEKQIIPLEEENRVDLSGLISIKSFINDVFDRNFTFDKEAFALVKTKKIFARSISEFSNNSDVRFGVRFMRPAGDYVYQELLSRTHTKLKDVISVPIVLGASVSPEDYDENGEYIYISMATFPHNYLDLTLASKVSDDYSTAKIAKNVQPSDIIVARSGEGTLGKVAYIDDDLKAIFADFTMRIRPTAINPKFLFYYLQTDYFQYLMEIHKKGLGNNMNIFPNQIQELLVLNPDERIQKAIVEEIDAEVEKQNALINSIRTRRQSIEKIVLDECAV